MRLFIAVTFDEELLYRLERLIGQCKALGRGRWTRRDNLHLTLEFLGELTDIAAAQAAMDAVTAPAFPLILSGLGFFRRKDGDLLWVGVEHTPGLMEVQRQLHHELKHRGFRLENRPYRPHLTLGRQVSMDRLPPCPTLSAQVPGISLMESRRENGALTYDELYWRRL